jgi:predicted SAM-dependent methyltransferase
MAVDPRGLVSSMQRLLYELAADVEVFGVSRPDLINDLTRLEREMRSVAGRLRPLRASHVARQLDALGVDLGSGELRVSLTGGAPAPWITVGFAPAEIATDLTWGLPFMNGSTRYVYFALALEHLFYPMEARFVLQEVRRILRDDGAVRIVVPDLEAYVRAYVAGDAAFFTEHRHFWDWAEHLRTPMEHLQTMSGAGGGRGPGDFFGHKNGYDFDTLRLLLTEAGFATVERTAYMQGAIPELLLDQCSHDAGFACGDVSYNLFVEARP